MAIWKRVLTTEDSTNNNLATQDLTVAPLTGGATSFLRQYNLPAANGGSGLNFRGVLNDDYPNTQATLLRLQSQADSNSTTKNFAYVSSLRIGNFDTDGPANGRPDFCGYALPQFSQQHQGGKLLVSTTSWTTSVGETAFRNFEDVVGPGDDGVGTAMGIDDLAHSDSLLVYDASSHKFRHLMMSDLPRSYYIQSGRNQEVNHGSYFMKGVNGVPIEQDEDGSGIIIPEDCTLSKLTLAFYKVSGGLNQRRKVKIWINGSTSYETSYTGTAYTNGEFVHKTFDAVQITSAGNVPTGSIPLNAGDRIAFEVFNTQSYAGLGKNFQVNALITTIGDGTP